MVDGVSLDPLLNGQGTLEDRALFWHYPHHHTAPGGAGLQGILDAWRKSVDAQMLNANQIMILRKRDSSARCG